ncbi:glycosyltransferase family 90 protein [Annulohypoxylon maeteangense]|uniref:glycosyltransferase family 90 protein n=1 Tax=Annulohypoxylon maeteangense TaxID=1927788 RepID=UPI002008158D|nr:glycosyltransferase family 90 protein [Annulohypoxylon maeteangense]KAI0882159.1 glycosyltransferase family 90 protein [Annulohypoxylon maeteangense]
MARDGGSRLTAVCFLASYIWLSCSLQRHSLIDQPRLSSFLLLFISGIIAFIASLFSKWLPGADGRFDSEAVIKGMQSSLPHRPRRFYVPCIIFLIVFRLEIVHKVMRDFQCATEGIEAFLPVFLAAHEFFSHRTGQAMSDDPEEMWGNPLDDFKNWLISSPITLFFSTILFSYGVFMVGDFTTRSSYFCSTLVNQSSFTVLIQWLGVFTDAVIIIMLWRVLSWARTTRSRLRTLGGILILSSTGVSLLWMATRVSQHQEIIGHHPFRGIGSLYFFDVSSTALLISTLIISTALWICDSTVLEPIAIASFTSGLLGSIQNVLLIGTYQQTSPGQPLLVLAVISTGFILFTYANNMRWIIFFKRVFLMLLLASIFITSAIFATFRSKHLDRHPVDDLVYKNRVEADRWLRHATVSTTLKSAVTEYKDRHQGRDPPPYFDKWFEFALQRKSVVIDRFDQVEKDIRPFWGMKQQKIQEGLDRLKVLPDIGIITIAEGKASHNQLVDPVQNVILDEAVSMISNFVEYLPDMSIAINMKERPRVLVPWDDIHRFILAGSKPRFQLLSSRSRNRLVDDPKLTDVNPADVSKEVLGSNTQPYVSPKKFRQLEALACPPGSAARGGVNWDTRDFCSSCVKPHSEGQFLQDWEMFLDPCHQPDIFNLHDLHTTPHLHDLHQDLLPLFSRSKTDSFNDILIPLVRPVNQDPDEVDFDKKKEIVFWQGDAKGSQIVTTQSLLGGHRHRLVHLANNASVVDQVSMLLGVQANKKDKFQYEATQVKDANGPLPFEFSFTNTESCDDTNCQLLQREFGFKEPEKAFDNRYVVLLDSADGPPQDLIPTLRSNSVPVLSSVFREWFTERLMPWVHFVPVDLRYHALHSTMAYFIGLKNRGPINGRLQTTDGRHEDARWIAEQGRKWADKAVRREDMEVYLFRLLLEWGRVIDENRDNLGFTL